MSKFLKWFLGILSVLAIFAAGVCVGVMGSAHMAFAHSRMFVTSAPFEMHAGQVIQVGPDGELPEGAVEQFGFVESFGSDQSFHGGKHHGGRFGGHHDRHAGGLIHIVLFTGLVYGVYWLGRRNARIVLDPKAGTPVMSAPAPEATAVKPVPKRSGKKIA